jgi:hypothetical protein
MGARRQAIRGDLRAPDRRNVLTCRHKLRIRGYTSTTLLTTYRVHATGFASSLIEGASPETILKAERGVASCGGRLVTACPGRQGPRPPGTTTWVRGARCTDPKANARRFRAAGTEGDGSAAPGAQNRHGGAPRGERPASWDARRLASAWRITS